MSSYLIHLTLLQVLKPTAGNQAKSKVCHDC
jgi:hypothetical protein